VTVSSHLPCSFSTLTEYVPASFLVTFAIVSDVMALIVSVLKRLASGSFPPLNDHVTFGCGLAANGSSTAVEPPTGSVSVVSASDLVNRGATVSSTRTAPRSTSFFMTALCNRAGHYIFALWFLYGRPA